MPANGRRGLIRRLKVKHETELWFMECFKMKDGWMKAAMICSSMLVASAAMFRAVPGC